MRTAGEHAPVDPAVFEQAIAAFEAGRSDEAHQVCMSLIAVDPAHAHALRMLGVLEAERSDYAAALHYLDRAVAADPVHPASHLHRGEALLALARPDEAIAAYRRALEINPHELRALNNMAIAYRDIGDFAAAEQALRQALVLDAHNPQFHSNLGILLHLADDGREDEALAELDRAVELEPQNPYHHAMLANIYEQLNRLEKAREAIARAPAAGVISPLLLLVEAKLERREGNYEQADAIFERYCDAAREAGVLESDVALHFQLGLLKDKQGQYDAAFENFAHAQAILHSKREADPDWQARLDHSDRYLSHIEELFDPARMAEWSPLPELDPELASMPQPIFLFGFARSGTTLLDTMLDAHPRLRVVEEKRTIDPLLQAFGAPPLTEAQRLAGPDAATVAQLQAAYRDGLARYADAGPEQAIVDKYPFNTVYAGFIHRALPDAPQIMMVRHPCDVCLSCFTQLFLPDLIAVHFSQLEATARAYARVMRIWRQLVENLPLHHRVVRYEELVDAPRDVLGGLMDFLQLEWDDALLKHHEHAAERGRIATPSYHQVAEPLYTASRYRWLNYQRKMEPVLDVLSPWIEYFGYDV